MKIFCKCPTINISKLYFDNICIAKNLIWTTLNAIFSIFCTLRFQIFKELYLSQILSDDVYISIKFVNVFVTMDRTASA